MPRPLEARLVRLERRAGTRALATLTDAELAARIVDLGDVLAASDDDADLTRMLRAGAAGDGLKLDDEAPMLEAWRAWRPVLIREGHDARDT